MIYGKLTRIQTKPAKSESLQHPHSGLLVQGEGLRGDLNADGGPRQISFLPDETAERMKSLGEGICTMRFWANLEGSVSAGLLQKGQHLRMGEAQVRVTQTGKECHKICSVSDQGSICPLVREVIFMEVIRSGEIAVGSEICVLNENLK